MKILHVDCSPRQESHSRELSAAIVKKLLEVAPDASISRRDLGAEPLPHTVAEYAAALSMPATLAAPPEGVLDLSEALIREIEGPVIVIGTPMYNFSISLDSQGVDGSNPACWCHDEVDAGREGGNAAGSSDIRRCHFRWRLYR
ncbi:NAD(P)H-dependent oxidoreductase [Mesorhizobium sp. M0166]|uniref:NAD(P)H-dependent oxidoreductase n=1 Tax=Mesorhizobium sp. M0166 TaxID=2956902 RepID=UPI00333B0AFE